MRLQGALQQITEIVLHPKRVVILEGVDLILECASEVSSGTRTVKRRGMRLAGTADKGMVDPSLGRIPAD